MTARDTESQRGIRTVESLTLRTTCGRLRTTCGRLRTPWGCSFSVAGVTGGAAPALACGALIPDRAVRCLGIVGPAPYFAMGKDFFVGMGQEAQLGYRRALAGAEALETEWGGVEEWIDSGLPGLDDSG